jgi:hypothetical protein
MGTEDAFHRFALVGVVELEVVGDVDALEDEHLVLLLDLALGDADEPIST